MKPRGTKSPQSAISSTASELKTPNKSVTSKLPEQRLNFARTDQISTAEETIHDYFEKIMETFNPLQKSRGEWKPVWGNRFSNSNTDLDKGMFNLGFVNGYQYFVSVKKEKTDIIQEKYSYRFDWDETEGMHLNLKYQHLIEPSKTKVTHVQKSKDPKKEYDPMKFDLLEHSFVYSFDLNRASERATPTTIIISRSSPLLRSPTPSGNEDKSKHSPSPISMDENQKKRDQKGRNTILRQMLDYTRKALEAKEFMPASDATEILRLFENDTLVTSQKHFLRFGGLLRPLIQAAYQESKERNDYNAHVLYSRVTNYLQSIWEKMHESEGLASLQALEGLGVFVSECLYAINPDPLNKIRIIPPEDKESDTEEQEAVRYDQERLLGLIAESFASKPANYIDEFLEFAKEFLENRPKEEFNAIQSVLKGIAIAPSASREERAITNENTNSNIIHSTHLSPRVRFMNIPPAKDRLTEIPANNPKTPKNPSK